MKPIAQEMVFESDPAKITLVKVLSERYGALQALGFQEDPFEIRLPDNTSHLIGKGKPRFTINIVNERGFRAIASFDEISVAEAYMEGNLGIDGEMLHALKYRILFTDRHPLHYLWVTYLAPYLRGQRKSDKEWIKSHYDIDP